MGNENGDFTKELQAKTGFFPNEKRDKINKGYI